MNTKTAGQLQIDCLYHYASFEKPGRLARIFTENTVYFSNPMDFNDPWDCRPCYSEPNFDDPIEYERNVQYFARCDHKCNMHFNEKKHIQNVDALRKDRKLLKHRFDQNCLKFTEQIIKQYRVFCLALKPDTALMWSHYAQGHKGICLEFSVRNDLFGGAIPVKYLDRYPFIRLYDNGLDENILPLIAKSSVWQYENEFRLVATEYPVKFPGVPMTRQGFLVLPEGALQAVIVGCLMPPEEREIVRCLVEKSGLNVKFKEAVSLQDQYALKIREA